MSSAEFGEYDPPHHRVLRGRGRRISRGESAYFINKVIVLYYKYRYIGGLIGEQVGVFVLQGIGDEKRGPVFYIITRFLYFLVKTIMN